MPGSESLEEARDLYERYLGNVPILAEEIACRTTLTRARARKLLGESVIEYAADLLEDYDEKGLTG